MMIVLLKKMQKQMSEEDKEEAKILIDLVKV
jgi:hypothetical protein